MESKDNYKILISPAAAEQVRLQLEKRGTPNGSLRLGIKGGGCNGFSYVIMFEDTTPQERDIVFQCEGINLIVDKKSLTYLNGCTLDWEQTMMKHGFKFVNPNEKSKCGCGHSFSV